MVAPLDGVRVVELANFVAAPAGGALMADLGADVIKIEPPTGDAWRVRALTPDKMWFIFNHDNRGKRSIVLDVTAPAGAEAARRLIDGADVFLTNLLPHRRARLGFDAAVLHARNPRLIYVGVTGYGPDGPDADRPGFDYSAFWASSGIMGRLVPEDQPPPLSRGALGDHTTGLSNLTATLAALRLRDMTGEGQTVELSLFSVGAWVNSLDILSAAHTGVEPGLHDREHPANPLWNTYRCADGRWLMLTMLQPDLYWERFCAAIDRGDWLAEERWQSTAGRAADTERLTIAIGKVFASATLGEWGKRLDALALIWAPVSTVRETATREQMAAQGLIQQVEVHGEPMPVMRGPFAMHGAAMGPRGRAPDLGEHSEAILREAGYDDAGIAALRAQGAFGAADPSS
jgi:crotonobetainyl-CoA:carnitine CoA-transferase CaiB-like acyl-CoA transferase